MTKQQNIGIALGLLIVILGFAFSQRAPTVSPIYKIPSTTTTTPGAAATSYTITDVATHKDASSCWSAINGVVYDLTSWIASHPGGEGTILSICGTDGSAAFNNQHGTNGRPERILESYKIGTLK
ncbi:MAG: cytochrome b5-like heme/steroid binding domain-containing protein [Candidatus Magasanikbacteria bacterium]|nr:cytochrome b5-like heme/steroid binding domain-containing protein [Candidatus Magasanikbacteria bacterium]